LALGCQNPNQVAENNNSTTRSILGNAHQMGKRANQPQFISLKMIVIHCSVAGLYAKLVMKTDVAIAADLFAVCHR